MLSGSSTLAVLIPENLCREINEDLLERGVALLEDEEIRGVARESFLEQKSRSEIGRKWCVSIATVTRRRQEAKILIAQYVDSYMKWKVEKLFY